MISDAGRHRIPLAIRQLCGEIHLPHGKVPPGGGGHQNLNVMSDDDMMIISVVLLF